ncbi:CHAT domain-containing protein [Streptomyces sp. NPDC006446]|uniref:CHAT domain-containing protein n=1 Tax=Streptomyces sp. NPDC006446 TaxID=3154301 RepID=UPI0033A1BE17
MVGSYFFYPGVYRLVHVARVLLGDACWVLLLSAAGHSWIVTLGRPADAMLLATTTGWAHTWVSGPGFAAGPAIIAASAFVVVRRAGVPGAGASLVYRAWLCLAVLAVAGTTLRCLYDTGQPFPVALAPVLLAASVAWYLRRRAGFKESLRATRCGYRPSWPARLAPRSMLRLRQCRKVLLNVHGWGINLTEDVHVEAARWFAGRGDTASRAWCLARLIEYQLDHNDMAGAEAQVRATEHDPVLAGQPAVLAACAQFHAAVGSDDRALACWGTVFARPAVPPNPARILAKEFLAHSAGLTLEIPPVTDAYRLGLVWRGQAAVVVRDLANSTLLLADRAGVDLLEEAYVLCDLPGQLDLALAARSDLGDSLRLRSARGTALMAIGRIHRREGRHLDAALAYLDADDDFATTHERRHAANCLALGSLEILKSGQAFPEHEDMALDGLRAGLQLLELDRLSLLVQEHRTEWWNRRRDLLREAFDCLCEVRTEHAKAAELGSWLLESLHRTLTVNLIRSSDVLAVDSDLVAQVAALGRQETDVLLGRFAHLSERAPDTGVRPDEAAGTTAAAQTRATVAAFFARLREQAPGAGPIDMDQDVARLRGNTAISYACTRDTSGWIIHAALMSARHSFRLHRTRLDSGPHDRDASPVLSPVGALDALAGASATSSDELAGALFDTSLDAPVWQALARALIPAEWLSLICGTDDDDSAELVIVPDGPLARLPFAALPLPDGRPLGERVAIGFTPALAFLREERDVRPAAPPRLAAVHLDPELEGADAERAVWEEVSRSVRVRESRTRFELQDSLAQEPRPDIAVVSAHGLPGAYDAALRLRDGSALSAAGALHWTWPPVVVLNSCWINRMDVGTGHEPFGLPLACLLRGATTVLAGIAPVDSLQASDLAVALVRALPSGPVTVHSLRAAVRGLTSQVETEWLTPRDFALMTAWITACGARSADAPTRTALWNPDGTARSQVPETGTFPAPAEWDKEITDVLRTAQAQSPGSPVGTLAFLSAAAYGGTRSGNDWPAFLTACGITALPFGIAPTEARDGQVTVHGANLRVPVTLPLLRALRDASRAARAVDAQDVTSAHVALAMLHDETAEATRWLTRQTGVPLPATALAVQALGVPPLDSAQVRTPDPFADRVSHQTQMSAHVAVEDHLYDSWLARRHPVKMAVAACTFLLAATHIPWEASTAAWLRDSHTGFLGVESSPGQAGQSGGAAVTGLIAGSPADQAGLRPGDLIVSVGGVSVPTWPIARAAIRARRPGSTVKLTLQRGSRVVSVPVELGSGPARATPWR